MISKQIKKRLLKSAYFLLFITFILGYFSPSLINYFIPEVKVTKALSERVIKTTYPVSGVVRAKVQMPIVLNTDIAVDKFIAEDGFRVTKGEPICKLSNAEDLILNQASRSLENQLYKLDNDMVLEQEKRSSLLNYSLVEVNKNIKNQQELIRESEELFALGGLSQDSLDLRKEKLNVLNHEKQNINQQIKAIDMTLGEYNRKKEELQDQLNKESGDDMFYIEDGYVYAKQKGILLNHPMSKKKFSAGESLGQFAPLESFDDAYLSIQADMEDIWRYPVGAVLELKGPNQKEYQVYIRYRSYVEQGESVEIKGYFTDDNVKECPTINQRFYGAITNLSPEFKCVVPKSCLITESGYITAGSLVTYYLVRVEDGILGEEYYAEEKETTVTHVADDYVALSIMPQEFMGRKIIDNVSYEIKDGMRVQILGEQNE